LTKLVYPKAILTNVSDTIQQVLERLSAFPNRASATRLERDAFDALHLELRGLNLEPKVTRFASPNTYSWDVIGAALLIGLGALSALGNLTLGFALAALGMSWFHCHFSGFPHPLEVFVPRYPSQNLEASFGSGSRHLIVMAHVDTARSAFLYNPSSVGRFRQTFVLNAALAYLTPCLIVIAAIFQGLTLPSSLLNIPLTLVGLYFLANAGLFLHRERTAPLVNGANDNASGVAAAIALTERLQVQPINARVTLLLTGCEEVGARGAAHFAGTLEVNPETLVLNLDNLGAGDLHYATGEGMLQYHPYDPQTINLASSLAESQLARPLEYRLAYFDTLPFVLRAIPCLTLIALEDGRIPNWHWPSDTLENVDAIAVGRAASFAEALARAWAEDAVKSA
jgi:Peptidase family M28